MEERLLSATEINQALSTWIRGDNPNEERLFRQLLPAFRRIVRGVAGRMCRKTGIPLDEELQDEILQRIWIALLKRRDQKEGFTSELPASLWVWTTAQFAMTRIFRSENRYALSAQSEDGHDWMDSMTEGRIGDPLESIMEEESMALMEQRREEAMKRVAPFIGSLPTPPETPAREREMAPIGPAMELRGVIRQLHWSQRQMAEYLGVSVGIVYNYVYGRTLIPDYQMDRIRAAEETTGAYSDARWDEFLRSAEAALHVTGIPLRAELAERMGVSERTLRRWIAGGDGSAKGLTRAVALRSRGWTRA